MNRCFCPRSKEARLRCAPGDVKADERGVPLCCPYDDESMEAFFGPRQWRSESTAAMRANMTKWRKNIHHDAARKAADTRRDGTGSKKKRTKTDEAVARAMEELAREDQARNERGRAEG